MNLTGKRQDNNTSIWFCYLNVEGKIREDLRLPLSNMELTNEVITNFEAGKTLTLAVLSALGSEMLVFYTVSN